MGNLIDEILTYDAAVWNERLATMLKLIVDETDPELRAELEPQALELVRLHRLARAAFMLETGAGELLESPFDA